MTLALAALIVSVATLVAVLSGLYDSQQTRNRFMATFDEINAKLDATTASLNEIATDIAALKVLVDAGQQPDGTLVLSPEQATTLSAKVDDLSARAAAAAGLFTPATEQPEPEEPPTLPVEPVS